MSTIFRMCCLNLITGPDKKVVRNHLYLTFAIPTNCTFKKKKKISIPPSSSKLIPLTFDKRSSLVQFYKNYYALEGVCLVSLIVVFMCT